MNWALDALIEPDHPICHFLCPIVVYVYEMSSLDSSILQRDDPSFWSGFQSKC